MAPRIIVVMGVTGAGKTTVGRRLAEALHCEYVEGDRLHSASNVEKMRHGIPLTDEDRAPWLAAIHETIREALYRDLDIVVGCSALKQYYRDVIDDGVPVIWIYLKGSPDLIRSRIEHRKGHFAKADLLASQLATLEEPRDAIVADIAPPPDEIVRGILAKLRRDPEVRVFPDLEEVSARAAEAIVVGVREAVEQKGRCSLALSGGSTPRRLYELLATRHRDRISWPELAILWCDERYVPPTDPRSNVRMAMSTLLDHEEAEAAAVYPPPTGFPDPEVAAREYETTLRAVFPGEWPGLDRVILGLGSDGHIASLFPGTEALHERARWVLSVTAPAEPPTRLTLTLPVITRAAHVDVLVAGAEKAEAVARALGPAGDPRVEPAASLLFARGEVVWWLDEQAAAELA